MSDPVGRAAYIIAQAAAAQIEVIAMQAYNASLPEGHPNRYTSEDFMNLIDKYGIDHNAVLGYLR